MDLSKRNKKVAIAGWNKIFDRERKRISTDDFAVKYKAAICGFLAGDGNVQIREKKSHYDIRFYPDDELMLTEYLRALEYVYGKKASITMRDNVFEVVIVSRTLTEDIVSHANFGTKIWGLPYGLFSVPGTKEAWLRAFFSAEAYVGGKHIKIQTVNKEGMLKVSELLNELNIKHGFYEFQPKNEKHSRVSIIMIHRKEARKRFLEKVGFWHSKKTEKLRKTLNL
ncbi:MAG: LAGLIDADG family homing endonuclease [archaeon]